MQFLVRWTLRCAVFFVLFAFALNNNDPVDVHFFFGTSWSASLALIVLIAFTGGVVVGVLGMLPWWWRHRQLQSPAPVPPRDTAAAPAAAPSPSSLPDSYLDGV
nr:LapA family protein [Candidatus Symbiobacter mobilis]